MSIHTALSLFVEEYPRAVSRPFAGDSVADFVRSVVPASIESVVANPRYTVQGSAGQGNWAKVPWVAVFDSLITDSAQDGFYLVYLVKEDFSGVHLSLNQGVTVVRERYGSDAKRALRARAGDFAARLGKFPVGFSPGKIDLATSSGSSLGAFYEEGSICSRYYARSEFPPDDQLAADLASLLDAYAVLADAVLPDSKSIEREDDEVGFEDLTKIRIHKRIERNQRLAKKVKERKGFSCEACGFSYASGYKDLDTDYIEAHHLVAFAGLTGSKVALDPEKDFAVLCADCHRMIHRSKFIHDIAAFRLNHLKSKTRTC
ncbi:MAG: DUF3578 domain-containing protein [Verrucomicrobia bacterium]|nr:DUF3578 domain-containing protein [Verrucomicrobiota bacterium]